jgi:MFS family permease
MKLDTTINYYYQCKMQLTKYLSHAECSNPANSSFYFKLLKMQQFCSNRLSVVNLFRALESRNYRLFFFGQCISLTGSWMQGVAMAWLVYQLTGSSLQLSVVMFLNQIPGLFITPIAGVFIDRLNKHKLLLIVQTLAMLQSLTLAVLYLTGTIEIWHIWVLVIFTGLTNSFEIPTRQSFMHEMIDDKSHLNNAIALNSTSMNASRLIGPAIAGVILAATNPGVCFFLNTISFFGVIIGLLKMKLKPHEKRSTQKKFWSELKDGFLYIHNFFPVKTILLLISLSCFTASSYSVLFAEFSVTILHGSAKTLGLLSSATGLGALSAALFLASRKSILGTGKWIGIGMLLMSIALIIYSQIGNIYYALGLLFIIGFGSMLQMACANTVIQTIVDPDKRGRVMSFYSMAFLGMTPLGSLATGYFSERIGIADTLLLMGGLAFVGAVVFWVLFVKMGKMIKPIYTKLGLLSPVTQSVEVVTDLKQMR